MLGVKILEERTSAINGKVSVVRSLGLGTYLQVNNLTQSGGVVYGVWKRTLCNIRNTNPKIQSVLILGLGGGSAARLIRKYWPAKITGVDIDPVMVEMGRKYLGLDDLGIKIVVRDALIFLTANPKIQNTKYDLILIDLYVGDKVPGKFESENFLRLVRSHLSEEGVAVFNRLYFGEKRRQATKFGDKLDGLFPKVTRFFPEANIVFICFV